MANTKIETNESEPSYDIDQVINEECENSVLKFDFKTIDPIITAMTPNGQSKIVDKMLKTKNLNEMEYKFDGKIGSEFHDNTLSATSKSQARLFNTKKSLLFRDSCTKSDETYVKNNYLKDKRKEPQNDLPMDLRTPNFRRKVRSKSLTLFESFTNSLNKNNESNEEEIKDITMKF
ncbi:MAG: hypothetical protein H0U70_05915 [Tatlockia sp.]|nr:hypothetical protein [Tatlockia sp.]